MTTLKELETNAPLVVTGSPQWAGDLELREPPGPEATLLIMDSQGQVIAFSGKVEYGQGIRSGFTLSIADELDISTDAVQIILGDTELVPFDRGTTGSASTKEVGIQLRRAAATARQTLVDLAARQWGVEASGITTHDGKVSHGDHSATYAELLQGQSLRILVPEEIHIKSTEEFRLMGRNAPRTDALARVTGQAKYSQDVVVDGMLYGKVLRPPSYGARIQRVDTSGAERVPGLVQVVHEGDFVGVICDREDAAEQALEAIRVRWQEETGLPSDWELPDLLKERARELVILRDDGSLETGLSQADHVLESRYYIPYVSNATMEPSASVAQWEEDRLTLWCGDRSPFLVREDLAQELGISQGQIRVIAPEVGGSFGTKGTYGTASEAARLAKAAGRPVRVANTRAEEFAWGTVRPAALIEVRSGVRADGTIVAWEHTAYHTGDRPNRGQRGSDTPYDTANVRIAVADSDSPLLSGSFRSLGSAANHFARESHIDEIAAAVGMDPVELRLKNLSHVRLRRALEQGAQEFSWESARSDSSTGCGVAIGYDTGSFAAEFVQLSVARRNVRLNRVLVAFDCGLVVNPEGARNQIEGAIVMGMGTALREAIEFDGGKVLNPTFSRYRVPRASDVPQIGVVFTGEQTTQSTGTGEPGIVPIAAAIANAVFDATGTRVRDLPIVPQLG